MRADEATAAFCPGPGRAGPPQKADSDEGRAGGGPGSGEAWFPPHGNGADMARKRCEQGTETVQTWHGNGANMARKWCRHCEERLGCVKADPLRAACTDANGAGGACRRGSGRRPNGLEPPFETGSGPEHPAPSLGFEELGAPEPPFETGSGPEHPVSSSRSNPNEETFEAQQRPVGRVRSGASSLPVGARRVGAPTGGARRRPGSFLGVGSGPEHPFAGVRRAWGPTDICRAPVRAPTGGGGGGG